MKEKINCKEMMEKKMIYELMIESMTVEQRKTCKAMLEEYIMDKKMMK